MAPEYPQALKEACLEESKLEGWELEDDLEGYSDDAAVEAGLLPKLSSKDIEDAFKAALSKLMEELAESQPQ